MFLYELAIELDVRSVDLAEQAVALGLGPLGPTADLTAEQAASLRAASPQAAGGDPSRRMPPMADAAGEGAVHRGVPPDDGSSGRYVRYAIIAVVVIAVLGLFAYMATNGGPGERERPPPAAIEAPAGGAAGQHGEAARATMRR